MCRMCTVKPRSVSLGGGIEFEPSCMAGLPQTYDWCSKCRALRSTFLLVASSLTLGLIESFTLKLQETLSLAIRTNTLAGPALFNA
jgi:hypothetical protein